MPVLGAVDVGGGGAQDVGALYGRSSWLVLVSVVDLVGVRGGKCVCVCWLGSVGLVRRRKGKAASLVIECMRFGNVVVDGKRR